MYVRVCLIALVALVAASAVLAEDASGPDYRAQWHSYLQKYDLHFSTHKEEEHSFGVFRANVQRIDAHNANPHSTFTQAVNKFTHLASDEFAARMNGLRMPDTPKTAFVNFDHIDTDALPSTVDWRQKGVVTPIKNQEQCGGCWSFSATGSIEGQHALKTGNLVSLSEQNLIDCSVPEGNDGCQGGLMDDAFQYVIQNSGVDTESSYPYTATGPNACKYQASNCGSTIDSYQNVTTGSEADLQTAVATIGPVSVAIDASQPSFQSYSGGVYYAPGCSPSALDHGVLVVGYGTQNGEDYWLVKNSWGTDWGLSGYIMMSRNRNNNCGIASLASYPIISGTGECADSGSTTGGATGGASTGGASTGGASTGGQTSGGYSTGGQTSGGYSTGGQTSGGYSTGGQTSGPYSTSTTSTSSYSGSYSSASYSGSSTYSTSSSYSSSYSSSFSSSSSYSSSSYSSSSGYTSGYSTSGYYGTPTPYYYSSF